MPGINGMDPSLMPSQTETIKAPKGADPSLYEGVQNGGQAEQPVSVFHSLDNQQQDGKVDYNEAKNSIFSHLNCLIIQILLIFLNKRKTSLKLRGLKIFLLDSRVIG